MSENTTTPERVCPHCRLSLARYEDPEAVKIIGRLERESDALRREKLQFMELYKLMPDIENQYEDRLFYHLANKLNILDCTQRQLAAAQKEIEEFKYNAIEAGRAIAIQHTEIEELKRDGERLDWIEEHEACINKLSVSQADHRLYWHLYHCPEGKLNCEHFGEFPNTLRSTIDSAIAQAKGVK